MPRWIRRRQARIRRACRESRRYFFHRAYSLIRCSGFGPCPVCRRRFSYELARGLYFFDSGLSIGRMTCCPGTWVRGKPVLFDDIRRGGLS